jgi:ubiquinone/menaquinone biosynthesis C-methylase UbiE
MVESVNNAGFTDVDASAEAVPLIRHLDQLAASDRVRASKRRLTALLAVRAGDAVIDVGCGTGEDARALAALVGPAGRVVGVDRSAALIAAARARAAGLGLAAEYAVGDACALDFPDASFDGCRMERVLHHLAEPQRAVDELARVCRPGGRLVLHEPDLETLVVDAPDRAATRAILRHYCDRVANGWAGRQLAGLAARAGFTDVAVEPETWMGAAYSEFARMLGLDRLVAQATAAGLLGRPEADRWLAGLRAADAAGTFFWGVTMFSLGARKP